MAADGAPVVLSLQERCLLYLITHVEDYSPQTLALLPRHLRRALLSSVPPLHLYQLASGIDTEPLWEDVSEAVAPILLDSNSREEFAMSVFLNALYRSGVHLVDEVCDLVTIEVTLFGLFEKRLSPGIAQYLKHSEAYTCIEEDKINSVFITLHAESYKEIITHDCDGQPSKPICGQLHAAIREKLLPCSCRGTEATAFFMAKRLVSALERAGAFPEHLSFSTSDVVRCKLWQPGKGGPIQPFFEKATSFILSSYDEPLNTTSSILHAVLSFPKVCLQELCLMDQLDDVSLESIAASLLWPLMVD